MIGPVGKAYSTRGRKVLIAYGISGNGGSAGRIEEEDGGNNLLDEGGLWYDAVWRCWVEAEVRGATYGGQGGCKGR